VRSVLTLRALNRATLARQMLLAREKVKPATAIERLAGLQSQWPKPPFVGLWTRIEGFSREDLRKATLAKKIVRATLMRMTIHTVSARDYVRFRPALQPALTRGVMNIVGKRVVGVDLPKIVEEGRAYFAKEPRGFEGLRKHFAEKYPKLDARALAYYVRGQLPLLLVPEHEEPWGYPGNADFALAQDFLGEEVPYETSCEELVRRYLAAFGPATMRDFQVWSYMGSSKETFDRLRDELVTFVDDKKRELFDLPKAPRPPEETEAPVRLLPEYDNIKLSYLDRRRFIEDAHKPKIFLAAARVRSTYLVDGFVAGAYAISREKKRAILTFEPFVKTSKRAREELAAEGEALVRFMEEDADHHEVRFEKV
jgi:hypothetical protein